MFAVELLINLLVDRLAPPVIRFGARGGVPLISGVLAGMGAFVLAVLDRRSIDEGFYSLCAQIFPVFLVALVVERRVADRLGVSENEFVRQSWAAWRADGDIPSIPPDEVDDYLHEIEEEYSDYVWVLRLPREKVATVARNLYRRRVAVESGTVLFAVFALTAGQIASLVGLAAGGTGEGSPAYWFTTSMLAASFTVVVASAAAELLRGVIRSV